jgi:YegS/Rv2252/BmrU family lipid kinase
MPKTLFIVNPNAGRVRPTWTKLEPMIAQWCDDFTVVMTKYPEDVLDCLAQSRVDNVEQVISIGGDGTNYAILNTLMEFRRKYPDYEMSYGTIPAGTGRDFARGVGLPMDTFKAAEYVLTQAKPRLIDIGRCHIGDKSYYFLNASNVGIAYDVTQRVENSQKRPWSFLASVLGSLTQYQPEAAVIELDGKVWFEGNIYVAAVANGKAIGQGILIAPNSKIDDGLFDVVVGEQMPTLELMQLFPKLYSGKHIGHPRVKEGRAKHVRIRSPKSEAIGLDLDGEPSRGAAEIVYEILPAALRILL